MARDPYSSTDLAELLIRMHYPERTDEESQIIRDWLKAHGRAYDRFQFSVRVGEGAAPDPSHLPGIQRQTVLNSKKRIDVIAWQGSTPTLLEVKQRIGPGVLGQLRTYARLYLWEFPQIRSVRLGALGRSSDSDTLRVLRAEGVDVWIYAPAVAE